MARSTNATDNGQQWEAVKLHQRYDFDKVQ